MEPKAKAASRGHPARRGRKLQAGPGPSLHHALWGQQAWAPGEGAAGGVASSCRRHPGLPCPPLSEAVLTAGPPRLPPSLPHGHLARHSPHPGILSPCWTLGAAPGKSPGPHGLYSVVAPNLSPVETTATSRPYGGRFLLLASRTFSPAFPHWPLCLLLFWLLPSPCIHTQPGEFLHPRPGRSSQRLKGPSEGIFLQLHLLGSVPGPFSLSPPHPCPTPATSSSPEPRLPTLPPPHPPTGLHLLIPAKPPTLQPLSASPALHPLGAPTGHLALFPTLSPVVRRFASSRSITLTPRVVQHVWPVSGVPFPQLPPRALSMPISLHSSPCCPPRTFCSQRMGVCPTHPAHPVPTGLPGPGRGRTNTSPRAHRPGGCGAACNSPRTRTQLGSRRGVFGAWTRAEPPRTLPRGPPQPRPSPMEKDQLVPPRPPASFCALRQALL